MQKCERCDSPATIHVTEVLGEGKFEEHHVCEQCYPKYVHDSSDGDSSKTSAAEVASELDEALFPQQACPECGLKFIDFRNNHRLGCARDYQVFRNELMPLLENIHGDTRHIGKTPRRYPQTKLAEAELLQLRQRLKRAVEREDYEEAARVRDQIKTLEEV
ncbi:MAG: UvrB/UvrC motif-containing protein [Planctomycetes bacterium]|jgi:protein arginine kinase activator|nr:UvrB/UvrC motif-containing protein [Planctomycetota bacterium]